jgi:hypothetical protein
VKDEFLTNALPQDGVEEAAHTYLSEEKGKAEEKGENAHVASSLESRRLLDRLGARFFGEPQSELLVIPPVVLVPARGKTRVARGRQSCQHEGRKEIKNGRKSNAQLVRRHLLHRVPRLTVKDEEERLIAKVADLGVCRRRLNVVARRKVELGFDVEHCGGFGVGPGGDEGRVEVPKERREVSGRRREGK